MTDAYDERLRSIRSNASVLGEKPKRLPEEKPGLRLFLTNTFRVPSVPITGTLLTD